MPLLMPGSFFDNDDRLPNLCGDVKKNMGRKKVRKNGERAGGRRQKTGGIEALSPRERVRLTHTGLAP